VRSLKNAACRILLIDRRNHHVFQPLLYQVATAALSPADIAQPVRSILRGQENVQVVLEEVTRVDLQRRTVYLDDDEAPYDWLVLAAGATHAYFGHDDWAPHAPGLKSLEDALEIRRRILSAFEAAEMEDDPDAQRAKLTFVVVGAGPTGVEMAGALREIAARTIPREFRRVDTASTRVVLLEGQDRVLPGMSPEASAGALAQLEALGVEVRTGALVTEVTDGSVTVGDERLPAENVIWAAGVRGAGLARTLGVELDPEGRVVVKADCSVPGHPDAFVVGDMAHLVDPETGRPVPGVAQGALQMGRFVGGVIRDALATGDRLQVHRPFHYVDKGMLATVGKARAVADIRDMTVTGFFAWILWCTVHIFYLVGLRNRVLVVVNWAWHWLVNTRGARLITGSPRVRLKKPADF